MAVARIERFDPVERALHWVNAALLLTLLFTGLAMYWSPMSQLIGRRRLMEDIHLISGLSLPVPFVLVLVGSWRRAFVRDARRLGRFLDDDWRWLHRRDRRSGALRLGKFNAGQKINAILVAGVLPVMLATGSIMQWNAKFSDTWRTGATFVHDWGFLILLVVVIGHIGKALGEPDQLRAMLRGWVPASWAKVHRPRWYDEVVEAPAGPPSPSGASPGPAAADPADEAVVEAG
jgi:formate dehydrogenase subunit gamma